jgi:predicted acyl esterase
VDGRSDVATFTSSPLSDALLLRGIPTLTLSAHADQAGFDLCVALSVYRADTKAVQQLSTGVLRILGDCALEGLERTVQLQALEAHLQTGDRLRLSIAAACWPAIAVNAGDPTIPPGPASSACRVTTLHLAMSQAELGFEPLITAPGP